jgi:DNA helicase-2/ATP-dependent DNA helicase PcrA
MTVHAAKGLEFPIVFIVALEEGLLPHGRALGNNNELEEERRLFFVGITRARRELYLSRCRVRSLRGQLQATEPSTFLGELPEGPVVVRDLSGVGPLELSQSPFNGSRLPFPREPRTALSSPEFRLMSAADLAAGPKGPIALGAAGRVNPEDFRVGVTVIHPTFGLGRLMAVEGEGAGRKGRVAFAVGPARTFILAQSPLRPIGRPAPGG